MQNSKNKNLLKNLKRFIKIYKNTLNRLNTMVLHIRKTLNLFFIKNKYFTLLTIFYTLLVNIKTEKNDQQ